MINFVIPNFSAGLGLALEKQARSQTGQSLGLDCLSLMLSKSTQESCDSTDAYHLVNRLLNVPNTFPQNAVSAVTQFPDQKNVWSCCVAPVIISPNRDHLDLAQVNNFDITEDEAKSFCDEFNDYFKDDGLVFSYTTPDKWFCIYESSSGFLVPKASPFAIAGQDIASHVPQHSEGQLWRRFFNEMQMLLHHSVTSQKRSLLKKPDINSVWYWGGGALDENSTAFSNDKTSVFTDDEYSKKLTELGGGKTHALRDVKTQLNDENYCIANIDFYNWLAWDDEYFSFALQSLKQGKIKRIVFYLDLDKKYILTKKDLMKFWKSKRLISDFLITDDENNN